MNVLTQPLHRSTQVKIDIGAAELLRIRLLNKLIATFGHTFVEPPKALTEPDAEVALEHGAAMSGLDEDIGADEGDADDDEACSSDDDFESDAGTTVPELTHKASKWIWMASLVDPRWKGLQFATDVEKSLARNALLDEMVRCIPPDQGGPPQDKSQEPMKKRRRKLEFRYSDALFETESQISIPRVADKNSQPHTPSTTFASPTGSCTSADVTVRAASPQMRALAEGELARYLNEQRPRFKDSEEERLYDVLAWWRSNEQAYPLISQVAKVLLGTQISGCDIERTFSLASRIGTARRTSLKPEKLGKLIMGKEILSTSGATTCYATQLKRLRAQNAKDAEKEQRKTEKQGKTTEHRSSS